MRDRIAFSLKLKRGSRRLRAEDGGVTADWAVLTAAFIGLGMAATGLVRMSAEATGTGIGASLASATVATPSVTTASILGFGAIAQAAPAPFDPIGCAGGMAGVVQQAAVYHASGVWPDGTFGFDYADLHRMIADARAYPDDAVARIRDAWVDAYRSSPDAFTSISNTLGLAIAECVAEERGV
ncbi:MAG: hypothetical protein Kow0013_07220 [Pararhodobacter sp.]